MTFLHGGFRRFAGRRVAVLALAFGATHPAPAQNALLEACNAIENAEKRLECLRELQGLRPNPAPSTPSIPDTPELTAQRARGCVDQERSKLKDPQSATLVAILGDRGMTESDRMSAVWIQYKATNSYGGFMTKSILCHPEPKYQELVSVVEERCAAQIVSEIVSTPGYLKTLPGSDPRYGETRNQYIARMQAVALRTSMETAKKIVEGTESLKMCNENQGTPKPAQPATPS